MITWKRTFVFVIAVLFILPTAVFGAETAEGVPDYDDPSNWAYFRLGEDRDMDVFLICPTVDTRSEMNSFDLNEKLKSKFVNALDMEKGIYEETGRLYSPYYRQMSMNAYKLDSEARKTAHDTAYRDISAAFRWYLDHENNGRGLILAGFSQGGEMCLDLLKEYYGGDGAEAEALRNNLIAVYAIGWSVTEELTDAWPQIVPAEGETDTGTVISFDCEDGTLTDSLVIPSGTTALSINPLNWRTDGAVADKSLNTGAVMETGGAAVPGLCGAYIGERGELVVTDVTPAEYPAVIDIFADGSYHIYDYMFFFTNLKENVEARTTAWKTGLPFKDVAPGSWYESAVAYVYEHGWINEGTEAALFHPEETVTQAELAVILYDLANAAAAKNGQIPVPEDELPSAAEDAPWYAEALQWAFAGDIAEEDGFAPDEEVTREEAVRMFWKTAMFLGMDVSVGEGTDLLRFTDASELSEGCCSSMQWAVGAGVIEGMGNGELSPLTSLTRAQTAVILRRLNVAAE